MIVMRNCFLVFLLAVMIGIMMSGCTAIAAASIAASRDPVDAQEQRDACDSGVSEVEESYHKTTSSVKHSSKVVCK